MFKLIALVFCAVLALVAAKPGAPLLASPALSSSYSYSSYGAPLTYSGYLPLGYNGYSGILGYNQLGYNQLGLGYQYANPYNYYI